MNRIVEPLVVFGRRLKAHGLPVGTGQILTFCRAAAALRPLDRNALYWAGRTTLVTRKDDFDTYDRIFRDHFGGSAFDETLSSLLEEAMKRTPRSHEIVVEEVATSHAGSVEESESSREMTVPLVASPTEVLKTKSFEKLTPDERARTAELVRRLEVAVPKRRSRRLRSTRRGARFDFRGTLRASLRTEGEPLDRRWRSRKIGSRPLVLILDVSASMSAYSRALLQFGYAALAAGQRVEVFCFGTRLTRITRALRTKDLERALERISTTVSDFEGGTRIGESLGQLLSRPTWVAAARGAVVVICSDGLERGDPEDLARQMARLSRLGHRVIWVNPLKGDPRYQPLARGMAAALPYVDRFVPGHNVASLESLAEVVGH